MGAPVESFCIAGHLGLGVEIGADGAKQVAVGDDPHQFPLLQHQQMAKVGLLEDILDDAEPIIHRHGGDPGRHNIPDKHANLP